MEVNVKSLRIERETSGNVSIFIQHEDMKHPEWIVISVSELRHFFSCLEGGAAWYPAFVDGAKYVRAHPRGLDIMTTSSYFSQPGEGKFRSYDCVFPGELIVNGVRSAIDAEDGKYSWTPEEIETIKKNRAPVVETEFAPEVQEKFFKDCEDYPKLADLYEMKRRIAKRHSDGKVAKVHIWLDWSRNEPPYAYMNRVVGQDGEQVTYGCLYPHKDAEGNFEYSSHT